MLEWKKGHKYILPKRRTRMIIAVCTKNKNLLKAVKQKKSIDTFVVDDINDIVIQDFDLVLIDIALCAGKLEVAKMQSSRTVFLLTDIMPESLDKVIHNFNVGKHPFYYKFSGIEYVIDLNDIVYFESEKRVVKAYYEDGECIRFYSKMDEVQQKIDDYVLFLRVNKSCMVNYIYARVERNSVYVPGHQFQVSRTYRKEFNERVKIIQNM